MSDEHTEQRNVPALIDTAQRPAVAAEYYYPTAGVEAPGTDWERVLRLLWGRKWWIVLAFLVGTGGGIAAGRFATKRVYEASMTIWLESQKQDDNRRGPIRAEEVFQGEGWKDVLRSFAVLEPVVIDQRVYLTPLEPKELPPGLFSNFSLLERIEPGKYELAIGRGGSWTLSRTDVGQVDSGKPGDTIGLPAGFAWKPEPGTLAKLSKIRFRLMTPRRAAAELRSHLNVFFDARASIITARLEGDDPDQIARLLNRIADRFIETATDLRSQNLREVVAFLGEQTSEAAEALSQAELAFENFKVETITLPTESPATSIPGIPSMRDPVFEAYFTKRVEAEQVSADIQALQRIVGKLREENQLDLVSLQLIQATMASMALQGAVAEYSEKELERRTFLYAYTEMHPDVQGVTGELETLRREVIPALIGEVIVDLGTRQQILGEQITAQGAELRRIPTRTIEEARRRREFTNAEALHRNLASRLKEAQLAEATESLPALRVLDRAAPPHRPTKNPALAFILFGSLAGIGLGFGSVLLLDRLDQRIRYPEHVTDTLGLPVLGVVPHLKRRDMSNAARAAIAIESFRALRTQISHVGGSTGITLVTSPGPEDGKSTVAANLAIAYASAGYRTVLVDGDTRRGRSQEMFGLEAKPGLTDYLIGRAKFEEVCQSTGIQHMDLLARGSGQGFDHELLGGTRMKELLSRLKTEYDIILVDAAPLAAGADALLLGERCDKVIIVVRAGSTDRKMAKAKLDLIGNVDLPIVGAVLNAVPETADYYPYYVSYYYADKDLGSSKLVS